MVWQRGSRRFIAGEAGVVTVYLLLVGSAVLVFFLAVFSYGRYLMAARQTELALEASLTSLLSFYEKDMAGEMGLFALDTYDGSLPDRAREYFIDNLGPVGAINGQTCLSYVSSYPAQGHLDMAAIISAQAVDMKRIAGWTEVFGDVLTAVGLADWKSLLSSDGPVVATGAGSGLAVDPAVVADTALSAGLLDESDAEAALTKLIDDAEQGWVDYLSEIRERGDERIRLWDLLSADPPGQAFMDQTLPSGIVHTGYMSRFGFDGDAAYWESLFLDSHSFLGGLAFIPSVAFEIYDFTKMLRDSIPEALNAEKNKLLLIEYIVSEMDFATNTPVMDRYFKRGEVEYILYGRESSWENIRHMALDVFILRTCLHMIDIAAQGRIEDLMSLGEAIVEAAVRGSMDVEKLFAGKRVAAYPGFSSITLSYKDHLRLFLSCRSEYQLQGALAELTQVNLWHWAKAADSAGVVATGSAGAYALGRYATRVQAIAVTELSLWPFGSVQIRREGVMGYDLPFTLLTE